jgi:15-cis-phytoene synthase/lycopene beta-cyclase
MRLCEKGPFLLVPLMPWLGTDALYRHVKYTIPPAIALTLLYRPLLTRLDVYKILFLVTV